MEGRVMFTDLYRNTSEELFIKTMMESSMGMPATAAAAPTMEMLGFKNLSQNFRTDSEELFKNWLNTENNGGIAHRTRQASRRISAELHGESSTEPTQHVAKSCLDKGLQATNLFLAKAWFNSSQPMTRSRSSELRRYAVMQNTQTSIGIEANNNMNNSTQAIEVKQEYSDPTYEVSNHSNMFMSPSNSSSCTFNGPQLGTADNISSVVNMLKGTLERKKLSEETLCNNTRLNPGQLKHNQMNAAMSREPSQSESSAAAAAAVVSTGFDTCDEPNISGQAHSVSESSKKRMANGKGSDNGPRAKVLTRYGSLTSVTSVEQGDPTKKRRVERSRKMAEAKERNMTPAVSSDIQSLQKRCENLEKEMRSLKLNLAFKNRKDSEQTKQIEQLQQQKEDLSKEKEMILEEIQRVISTTCKM